MSDSWHLRQTCKSHQQRMLSLQEGRQLNAEHKGRETPSEDEDEPRQQNTGGQKKFPPEVKTVNMIHVTKRRSKHALRDIRAVEPVTPKFNPWLACPITFDHRDHPTSTRHEGLAALVLDPIINGYHLTRVLMDGGSSLNLIYQGTVRKMGIDPTKISHSNTTFKGVILGQEARFTGSLLLEVVFGSPDNFRSEELIFDIAPF